MDMIKSKMEQVLVVNCSAGQKLEVKNFVVIKIDY